MDKILKGEHNRIIEQIRIEERKRFKKLITKEIVIAQKRWATNLKASLAL